MMVLDPECPPSATMRFLIVIMQIHSVNAYFYILSGATTLALGITVLSLVMTPKKLAISVIDI